MVVVRFPSGRDSVLSFPEFSLKKIIGESRKKEVNTEQRRRGEGIISSVTPLLRVKENKIFTTEGTEANRVFYGLLPMGEGLKERENKNVRYRRKFDSKIANYESS